jgi:hypothetical protein
LFIRYSHLIYINFLINKKNKVTGPTALTNYIENNEKLSKTIDGKVIAARIRISLSFSGVKVAMWNVFLIREERALLPRVRGKIFRL